MNARRFTFDYLPRLPPLCKHAFLLCALAATACGRVPVERSESRVHIAVDRGSPVDVHVSLSAGRASQQARWTEGAASAVRHHVRMLGVAPAATITIVDRPSTARDTEASWRPDVIAVAAPLWSSQRGMAVEAALARAVALTFWRAAIPCNADQAEQRWFGDGLARYTATVSLSAQYDGARQPPSVGALEQRYVGGFLPWVLRASELAWTAGNGLSVYRAHPGVDPSGRRSASDRDALEAKTALAMQTLANWVGSPTWEAVLRSFVAASRGRCASWRDLQQAAGDVTGLDLSWFFDEAFGSGRVFDYGVERLSSERLPREPVRYRTELVVRRFGDAMFTGTSQPPIEPFESGRGVEIVVRFADGVERAERWDGRALSRRFEYEGSSPAESATVDPRQIILLDLNRTNNSSALMPRAASPATRWSVVWTVWFQHLLLSYGSLV
jgi:hypothetical protein